jgi:putative transposase
MGAGTLCEVGHVSYHRRNLPHYYPPGCALFLTWRLFGSLPAHVSLRGTDDAGRAFVRGDRVLDEGGGGPLWLGDSVVAGVVADALRLGGGEYGLYKLLAWVVMPNHVHVVLEPHGDLSRITRWVKGSTARAANLVLGRTGRPFWQYESYDHCVRSTEELNRVIRYVEGNPVKAGLVAAKEDWIWSSAAPHQGT